MRKTIIIFSTLILLTVIGLFTEFYDFKTSIIIIVSIVIGGFIGGKLLNN